MMALSLLAVGCSDAPTRTGGGGLITTPLSVLYSWGRPAEISTTNVRVVGIQTDGTVCLREGYRERILRFDDGGQALDTLDFGVLAPGAVKGLTEIKVGQDDHFYLLQSSGDGPYLHRLSPVGQPELEFLVIGPDSTQVNDFNGLLSYAAAADGRLYLADEARRRILCYGADGKFRRAWGSRCSDPGSFEGLGSIVIAPDGSVLAGDRELRRIQRFTAEGELIAILAAGEPLRTELYNYDLLGVTAEGTIYGRSQNLGSIVRIGRDGEFLGLVDLELPAVAESHDLLNTFVDRSGRFYLPVARFGSILRLGVDGRLDMEFLRGYGQGEADIRQLRALEVTGDGRLLALDSTGPFSRVRLFSDRGDLLDSWLGNPSAEAPNGREFRAIAATAEGRFFAYDLYADALLTLRPGGRMETLLELPTDPDGASQLRLYGRIAVADNGWAYLQDGSRLFIVDAEGTVIGRPDRDESGQRRFRLLHDWSVGPDGDLWLLGYVDRESGGVAGRLARFGASGNLKMVQDLDTVDGVPEEFSGRLTAIRGGVWINGDDCGCVVRFDRSGRLVARRGLPGPLHLLRSAARVGADDSSRLFYYEPATARIHVLDASEGQ